MGIIPASLMRRVRFEVQDYTLPDCGLLITPLNLLCILAVFKMYSHIVLAFSSEYAATGEFFELILFYHSLHVARKIPSRKSSLIRIFCRFEAIAIVLLNLPSLLLQKSSPLTSPASLPLWIRLLLILDLAVEFPLLFAFHPTTLTYNPHRLFPSLAPEQLVLQVFGFLIVEFAFQNCALRFVSILDDDMAKAKDPHCGSMRDALVIEDRSAEDLMVQFLRPRGALLVAVALMGAPTAWTTYAGLPHPMAMAVWLALQQTVQF